MTEFLIDFGRQAWHRFWVPIIIWSCLTLVTVLGLRAVPKRQIRLHLDIRVALLLALPIGLIIANLLSLATGEVAPIAAEAERPDGSVDQDSHRFRRRWAL